LRRPSVPGETVGSEPVSPEPLLLDDEGWDRLWSEFSSYAFRLETLPVYKVEDEREEFESFLRGDPPPPELAENEWIDGIRAATAAGKAIQRVRILTPPLGDYLRYEFEWGYAFTAPVGEDIRIMDLSKVSNPGLPDRDFWLFDGETVVMMRYDNDGAYLGAEIFTDGDLDDYKRYRQLAIQHSVPFQDYWRSMKS
jgi:hypothetical protein